MRPRPAENTDPQSATTPRVKQGSVTMTVNGITSTVDVDPLTPLADVLRDEMNLTGTKLGCRAGDCGSCTILVDGEPVASCLVPVAHADGKEVTTIEGAHADRRLKALQEGFAKNNACQCGYCIPGFIMAARPLVNAGRTLTRGMVTTELSGNLCRCTGYDSIIAAVFDADASLTTAPTNPAETSPEAAGEPINPADRHPVPEDSDRG
jgi:carbon-monoxide dehydrogenase small subunit